MKTIWKHFIHIIEAAIAIGIVLAVLDAFNVINLTV